jgi:predicted nucleic acid-binding protein
LIYVLDACSLIALFKKEKGIDKIITLFDEAQEGQHTIYIHSVNLIEVYYHFCRVWSKEKADIILDEICNLPINIVDIIDDVIFSETSRFKATYPIPLGDAFGLATAIKTGGTLVTADHSDFEEIEEKETVSLFWFRD